jgi:predicted transcriptional regulator
MEEVKTQGGDINLIELAGDIVCAYVGHNAIAASDLPKLLSDAYEALLKLGAEAIPSDVEPQRPAVPIRKSITPDYIVCLEEVQVAHAAPAR